jgi:hypothetical protein
MRSARSTEPWDAAGIGKLGFGETALETDSFEEGGNKSI